MVKSKMNTQWSTKKLHRNLKIEQHGWNQVLRKGLLFEFHNYANYLSTGNDSIHTLTSQGRYKLRIDIEYISGDARYVVYDVFIVGDEASQYLLYIDGYSGNVGKMFNSIIYFNNRINVSCKCFFCMSQNHP